MARPTEPVERERSDEFRQLAPPPSEEVKVTYVIFEKLTGIDAEKMLEEGREIVKVTFDFAGTKGPVSSTYEAAYLMPLMKRLSSDNPVEADAAKQALFLYNSAKKSRKDPDYKEYIRNRKYVRAISVDQYEIDMFLRSQYDEKEELAADKPDDASVAERQYQNPYLKKYKKKPFEDALELMADEPDEDIKDPKGINIESTLLSAVSAYQALRHSDDMAEDDVLKTIYASETFYEPALDILSFGALGSMAFKREVDLIKLSRNGGQYGNLTDEKLAITRDILSRIPPPEKIPEITAHLLWRLTNMHAEPLPVLHDTSGHGITFMAGKLFQIPDKYAEETGYAELDIDQLDYRGRLQTDVKFASKITISKELDDDGKEVTTVKHGADLVGATIIFQDEEELWKMYERAVVNAEVFYGRTTPTSSRSKNTPLHVSGEKLIQFANRDSGVLGEIDTKVKDSGYEAAKITLVYTPDGYDYPIPYEIAFQTVAGRFDARVGKASHAFQDEEYDNNPKRIRISKGLHTRRMKISEPGLTPRSEARAERFFSNVRINKRAIGGIGIRSFIRSDDSAVITFRSRRP